MSDRSYDPSVDLLELVDELTAQRDAARDMCIRLEHAIYKLGAWNPDHQVGREMIAEDLLRGGAASIERTR